MIVTIYLVRHAIAEDHSDSGRDADRRLTAQGTTKMQRACAGLARLGVAPDVVYTSPLLRARQTADILCDSLGLSARPQVLSQLAPGDVRLVPPALRPAGDVGTVALVGHEPDMGQLAALLIGCSPGEGNITFKKGGVAAIEVGALPPRTPGTLAWLLTPRQLRALGDADE